MGLIFNNDKEFSAYIKSTETNYAYDNRLIDISNKLKAGKYLYRLCNPKEILSLLNNKVISRKSEFDYHYKSNKFLSLSRTKILYSRELEKRTYIIDAFNNSGILVSYNSKILYNQGAKDIDYIKIYDEIKNLNPKIAINYQQYNFSQQTQHIQVPYIEMLNEYWLQQETIIPKIYFVEGLISNIELMTNSEPEDIYNYKKILEKLKELYIDKQNGIDIYY